ncbi:MAG: N-acetyl-anhydromuramyl-L-alanine amidase AmpD [Bacteroidia bacterium]|jgi:N-acetyl-anhydromuramyl-L-alanine amidase AmpD
MKRIKLVFVMMAICSMAFSQNNLDKYTQKFEVAYLANPKIPEGMLEAMAWYHSHGVNLKPSESCIGMPTGFGLFNLLEDGKGFFHPTALMLSKWSGITVPKMKADVGLQVQALGSSYSYLMDSLQIESSDIESHVRIIMTLSSIPSGTSPLNLAMSSEAYEILKSYNRFADKSVDLRDVFGDQFELLSSTRIDLSEVGNDPSFNKGLSSGGEIGPCYDYPSHIYTQTPACNYNTRAENVSAVTIHTIQGSYAGAIAWAQNCNANVSYHYVVRSSDGQVTQMLCESDRGWHVGTENDYAIGIEHEGYVTEPSWYTEEMYFASSNLVKDISESGYEIDAHRTAHFPWSATAHYNVDGIPGNCNRIKGHQHFPNQTHTDPGANWDWDYFYKLIDPIATEVTITDVSGSFTDDGGVIAPYSSDLRTLTLFEPVGSASIELAFTAFDLEPEWDYLYIYDGWSVFDPLIGVYTGTGNPGTVTSTGGSLLVEFRSDCSIGYNGWEANFLGQFTVGVDQNTSEELVVYPNPTSGLVHLPSLENLKWAVLDLKGRTIAAGTSDKVDLRSLNIEPQVLLMRVTSDDRTTNQRLVFSSN